MSSRRGLLAAMGAGALLASAKARAATAAPGLHQPGIVTPAQAHICFMALDLDAKTRAELATLLRDWTQATARLTAGQAADADDGGSATGLPPANLTLTFGFGPSLFQARYGLAAQRPEALADLPKFHGDQLDPARCDGDLCIQACADDPQVALHAIRELVRIGYGRVRPRWMQSGFQPKAPAGQTPRNLMGFKDGTNNPGATTREDVPRSLDEVVWAGDEAPAWMRGGSYLVARRIRISLEHWDRTPRDFQEEVIGRHKASGAPIGQHGEFDRLGLERTDGDGNPIIGDTAHVRLGSAMANAGAQIHRRAYAYDDGLSFTAERWPPWRQGMMLDAGLFFLAYQRDPRTGFTRMFETMAKFDALNQYTTHTGSALFACPPGAAPGSYPGQPLFEP